jgi:hypothetical protein
MQKVIMDARGRVTVGSKLAKRYGKSFIVVQAPNEIILIPEVKDPIADLRKWGKKGGKIKLSEVGKLAEEQAYKEIKMGQKQRNRK